MWILAQAAAESFQLAFNTLSERFYHGCSFFNGGAAHIIEKNTGFLFKVIQTYFNSG
jgi:hypothetical protein